ncbi:zinc ribbon domain-containing protein [Paucibacter sp. B2R-40]|uniref:double zinc ribbon domain-containing protein n=1 Tax=Paucibacter sp. B2R-40 TaxID=2893554 RepID=UPI0021E4294B|nr:zinc ribbon domain-containing protein [Paucibacter sp. B2R-40]MCV2356057.1 zinc ribbon domain-containing protein [Paucibacter sp. B2R-40]
MPTARSNSQCPYCDHVSPAGSKFCNDCGAALHLRPCPHCGSVNDITQSTHCSRCNGDLGFNEATEPADIEVIDAVAPAPVEMPLLSEVIESTSPQAVSSAPAAPYFDAQPKPARSFAPLLGIAVIAVAAASYFGLRTAPEAKPVAAQASNAATLAPAALVPRTAALEKAAAPTEGLVAAEQVTPAPSRPQEALPTPAFAASLAKLSPPGAGRPTTARREAAFVPAAPAAAAASPGAERYIGSSRTRANASEGLDLKQPNIGTCTDAVAALGLCAQESNPRRP